jgi:hypothetical protein
VQRREFRKTLTHIHNVLSKLSFSLIVVIRKSAAALCFSVALGFGSSASLLPSLELVMTKV